MFDALKFAYVFRATTLYFVPQAVVFLTPSATSLLDFLFQATVQRDKVGVTVVTLHFFENEYFNQSEHR